MESLNKIILSGLLLFSFSACGVKSRPLVPKTPPPLGRGEPTQSPDIKKKEAVKNRYNNPDDQDSGE